MLKWRAWALAVSLSMLSAGRAAVIDGRPIADDSATVRQEFVAAMQRVRLYMPEPPDSSALQGFAIRDYLIAARLQRDLILRPGEDLDADIDAFLTSHANQPVAHAIRHDWLLNLAARQRWDWFLPRTADVTDSQLICERLQGRLVTGDTAGLVAQALARWNLPQKSPRECDGVFAWLRLQGVLTPALAEERTRAALSAANPQLAREFAADVPAAAAASLLQWAQMLEVPKPTLTALAADASTPVEEAALLAGFGRLANSDSAAALRLLPLLLARPDMTAALAAQLQRAAALGAAYDHDPAAMAAFRALAVDPEDNDAQEWRVRAALWAGDYEQALTWIGRMSANLAAQPRWRYWRARAVAATSGREAAVPIFAEIAGLRDYYGYLAADRLQHRYALNVQASPDDDAQQSALAAQPGLIRAHELFDCALTDDAMAEWAAIVGAAPPEVKLQAAHLAARWGWYAQSIATLAQAGEWDDVRLRYPHPYSLAIAHASMLTQVPPDWILAVMRQESLFRTDAVSRADARGLMQLQPATAAGVARRWHLPLPGADTLFDADAAATLGAAHLRDLLDHDGGQLDLSLAAYNAGSAAVARWLPSTPMDADVWIENIPYGETRGYVQHILEHIVALAWVRNVEPPRLATLLTPIQPTVSATPLVQPLSSVDALTPTGYDRSPKQP